MTQPAKALAHRAGLRAARTLSQIFPGSWMGMTAWNAWVWLPPVTVIITSR